MTSASAGRRGSCPSPPQQARPPARATRRTLAPAGVAAARQISTRFILSVSRLDCGMRPHPRAKDERAETECNSPTRDGHDGAAGAPGLVGELYISYSHKGRKAEYYFSVTIKVVTYKTVNESVCACFEHDESQNKTTLLFYAVARRCTSGGTASARPPKPRCVTLRPATAQPQRSACAGVAPRDSANSSAAMKVSPAPTCLGPGPAS